MAEAKPTLDALRAEIDAIDDQLHRLVMQRAQVALAIGAIKNSHGPEAGLMRPSREALLLRRLAAKEDGPFPKSVVVRLWREIIAAVLRLQGSFSVAVYAPEGAAGAGYWDLARDYFGSLTPATAHDSPQQVLNAVTAGRAVVGVLPLPDGGDPQPWWPMMLARDPKHPRIVARLPFGSGETVRGAPIEALALAQSPIEETGQDRSLVVIETTEEISRSTLLANSREVELPAAVIQTWRPPSETAVWLHLMDVEGFVPLDDRRLTQFGRLIGKGLQQIWHIGGYAVPLSPAELGPTRKGSLSNQFMALTLRPGIAEIAPYVGGEASLPGIDRPAKLSSNENPLGPSPKAMAAFREAVADLHRYPDGGAERLRAGIARRFELEAERIVCGNGSDELIALLSRAYAGPGDEVLFSRHGFLMYRLSTLAAGARPTAAPETNLRTDVAALLDLVTSATRILYLGNPNNPTGSYLSASELRALRRALPAHVLLVIDAAYAEYVEAADYDPGQGLVREGDHTVMLRTFSKIYGLAGLRLGWAYCPPEIADALNRVRGPFNTSVPAQAAALAALEDVAHEAASREHNRIWRDWLAQVLAEAGYRVHPSVGNFLLVEFADADAADAFLKSRGLIMRKMGAYGLPHCLRITIGTEAETRATAAALAEFAGETRQAAAQ